MRISSIRLKNFKRFTDLAISNIPATAKLVVVVGPNGCGKSSLFDALIHWHRFKVKSYYGGDDRYYRKDDKEAFNYDKAVDVNLHGNMTPTQGSLYVRTAYRNDPDFSISQFTKPKDPTTAYRIERAIQNDQAVSDNYQRLIYDTMAGLYNPANNNKSVEALRNELIGEVRASMLRVFGDLTLNNLADPLSEGSFYFGKGETKSYHFKNLSGGEKAAFDLLLDIHVKKKFYTDAIYCIDEMETHLHTRVQGALLKEMVAVLPNESQLWITTHSLGVIRAAQEMVSDNADSVCVIDFESVDPDIPREIRPSSIGRVSWEKLLSIALDDLSQRIAPKKLVICEGSTLGNRRRDFDAEIYNRILGAYFPDVLFVSGGSSNQVAASGVSVRDALSKILPTARVWSLADRDDKSEDEVREAENKGTLILSLRNLESFLFADEVIEALLKREGKEALLAAALNIKEAAVTQSVERGNAVDDLKSAAGNIYIGLKKLLSLQRCGNTTDAFMRDTLALLIEPPMHTFTALKSAIIDRLT